ncbi:MAG: hypothetical protein F6K14_08365 [Symploca sp. SIO2C1]|nr:hypothetical protein [Symploca sp. SIO2C1]
MDSTLIQNDPFEDGNFETQSIDGSGNNLQNPELGTPDSPLLNIPPLDYSDGFSTPTGQERPNPRVISNALSQQDESTPEPGGRTNLIWAWGQFTDHDLSLTPELSRQEAAEQGRFINVPVPAGDPFLDPQGTGNVEIEIRDAVFIEGTGTDPTNPRQLPNVITTWIDGSNVYGSNDERTNFLRSFEGGKLKISEGNLLPFNDGTVEENDNPTRQDPTSLFVAGDVRANENSVLTSLHTLFMREHNRLADALAEAHPDWTDEQLFQRARQINVAQMQSITYNEYLPTLLGSEPLPDYTGYDPSINPNISRTFSTAAFRLGHTQLSSEILRLDVNGEVIPEGNLTLSEVFFPQGTVIQETGIDPIIRGIASSLSQRVDNQLIDDVRNLLFGFGPNASARDLSAINIQRGRHNGLADYNTIRESFGLPRVTSFAEITSDSEKQVTLGELYGSVDNIDAFVGMLAEDLLPGGSVGQTIAAVLTDQFARLRDGDRFYYENVFTPEEIAELSSTSLSDIIRRNTDTSIIQDNAFSLLNRGTSGNDVLNGGLGNDTIFGESGNDHLLGHVGDDALNGGHGNDTIEGSEGNDILRGGFGNDTTSGGRGNDNIFGNQGDDLLQGGSGNDSLNGNFGNDRLFGESGDDLLRGGFGNDLLDGDAGQDILNGGVGNDSLNYSSDGIWTQDFLAFNAGSPGVSGAGQSVSIQGLNRSFDQFIGGDGIDTIFGTAVSDALFLDDAFSELPANGTPQARITGVEVFQLGDGNDIVDLTSTVTDYNINTTIFGGNGNDTLWSSSGDDTLNGGNGNDSLAAGAGNDTLNSGSGNDILNGGSGNDTADYSTLGQAITLETAGVINKGSAGTDQIQSIETIIGATGQANAIDGSTGTSGTTSFDIDLSANSLTVNGIPGIGTATFTIENFVDVTGTSQNDTIIGNSADNLLGGAGGYDILTGGGGQDTFVLGDASNAFYEGNGFSDYAFITDFTSGEDLIQLSGDLNDYTLGSFSNFSLIGSIDNGAFDLIAFVDNGGNGLDIAADITFA